MRLSECWGRDGIQAEAPVATSAKLAVLDAAGRYGASRVEVTSFARPETWPQFADAGDVVAQFTRHNGVEYAVYVPNVRGYERLAAVPGYRDRVDTVLVAVAATDAYNQKNVRRDTMGALAEIALVIEAACGDGLKVIGCVGTAWSCPIEGPVSTNRVLELVDELTGSGAHEVMLGDTTGQAHPKSAASLVHSVRGAFSMPVIGHFHDMRGTALANAVAAADAGADWIDCALGGIGGHPPDEHQPAAAGNLCTEDFATVASAAGLVAGLDLAAMLDAGRVAEQALGRRLLSRVQRAGLPDSVASSAGAATGGR